MRIISKTIATILNLRDNFSSTINNVSQNTKRFQQEIKHTQNQIKDMKSAMVGAFSSMAGRALATVGIAEVGRQSIMLASDLQEVQNVVDVTFTNGAKQINEWSQSALKGFGLSELQAKQFNGTLGALMKSSGVSSDKLVEMSTKLTGLSGDFASFYNLRPEEAFEKIRSGISGETEPLKSLGINMSVANMEAFALSQGITKSWNSMNQAEQTLLRYNYLMQTSKDAQGDFTRTQTSFANQLRIATTNLKQMGASLGSYLLPFLNKALQTINGFINNAPNIKANILSIVQSFSNGNMGKDLMELLNKLKNVDYFSFFKQTLENSLDALKKVYDFFNNNWSIIKPIIEGITAGLIAYEIALGAVVIKQKAALIIEGLTKAWEIATIVIGALRNGMTLAAVAQEILNIAMAANPFAVIAIAIGLVVMAGIALYKNWDKISAWLGNNFTWLKNQAIAIFTSIATAITNNPVFKVIEAVFKGILAVIIIVLNSIWNVIVSVWNSIYNSVAPILTTIWTFITDTWNSIYSSVSDVVTSVWTTIVSGFNSAYDGVTGIFNSMYETIVSIFQDIWGVVKGIINGGIEMINGFIGGVNSAIEKANKLPGVNIGTVGKIPMLANGGITTRPTLAMIGEGKEQEAVMPLSKLQNVINTGNVDSKGSKSKDKVVVYVTIQGNVIGDEEFADQVGEHVYKKVKLVLDNM